MTKDDVLKLALEALEAKGDAWIVLERKAKAAIRKALAEQPAQPTDGYVQQVPDQCDRIVWRGSYYHLPLKPAQQQEPVAWINWSALTGEPRLGWTCESEIASEPLFKAAPAQQQEPVTDEENEKFSRDVSNFNGADPEATKYALEEFLKSRAAPPASKPWVGLTDDEIEDIHCTPPRARPRGKFPFARMIEAAHGIKE